MNSIEKACRITSIFEGRAGFSSLTGNFDGQGMSFGFLQFNAGQGTLYALLKDCYLHMPGTMAQIFAECNVALQSALTSQDRFFKFTKGISTNNGKALIAPWHEMFVRLGQSPGCQKIQMNHAERYVRKAKQMMAAYHCLSERAFCFFFDVAVQNGSVVQEARDYYRARLKPEMNERERLGLLAKAVAVGAIDRWEADVLSRKKAIVDGQGKVHGSLVKCDLSDGPAVFE